MAEYLAGKEEIMEAITIYESSGMLDKALNLAIDKLKVKKVKEVL